MKKIILGVIIIVFAALGAFLMFDWEGGDNAPPDKQALEAETQTLPAEANETIINMKDDVFESSKITIKKGSAVKFINIGSASHWPASNIHPTHQIYPEFDPQTGIAPGASWTFVFDKTGAWRFHDHLYPNLTGTITVEE